MGSRLESSNTQKIKCKHSPHYSLVIDCIMEKKKKHKSNDLELKKLEIWMSFTEFWVDINIQSSHVKQFRKHYTFALQRMEIQWIVICNSSHWLSFTNPSIQTVNENQNDSRHANEYQPLPNDFSSNLILDMNTYV